MQQIKETEIAQDTDPEEFNSPVKKVHSINVDVEIEEPLISDFNAFFLCISLGWLFENPSFPRELFIEETNSNFFQECVNSTKSTSNLDGNQNLNMNMNLNLLYNCCPYVSELKVILCQFHTGFKASKVTKRVAPMDVNKIVKTSISSQGTFDLIFLARCEARALRMHIGLQNKGIDKGHKYFERNLRDIFGLCDYRILEMDLDRDL